MLARTAHTQKSERGAKGSEDELVCACDVATLAKAKADVSAMRARRLLTVESESHNLCRLLSLRNNRAVGVESRGCVVRLLLSHLARSHRALVLLVVASDGGGGGGGGGWSCSCALLSSRLLLALRLQSGHLLAAMVALRDRRGGSRQREARRDVDEQPQRTGRAVRPAIGALERGNAHAPPLADAPLFLLPRLPSLTCSDRRRNDRRGSVVLVASSRARLHKQRQAARHREEGKEKRRSARREEETLTLARHTVVAVLCRPARRLNRRRQPLTRPPPPQP